MSIGENIRRLREEKNFTQKQLAEAVYITPSMLCQIERGTKIPSMPLGKEIASVLKCNLDELYAD